MIRDCDGKSSLQLSEKDTAAGEVAPQDGPARSPGRNALVLPVGVQQSFSLIAQEHGAAVRAQPSQLYLDQNHPAHAATLAQQSRQPSGICARCLFCLPERYHPSSIVKPVLQVISRFRTCSRDQPSSELRRYFSCGSERTGADSLTFWACTTLSPPPFAPGDLPKINFRLKPLANPRNFLDVKLQKSGGIAETVRGFAKINDAGMRVVQAHHFPSLSVPAVARWRTPWASASTAALRGWPQPGLPRART